jgi:hypothetical protein
MNRFMEETRDWFRKAGLPDGDLYGLPDSAKRFEDGGQYRFEVPGIQGPAAMKSLLERLDDYGIRIHRITQTKGIMSLTDAEIEEMQGTAQSRGINLVLAVGPRAVTDTSASVRTEEGQRMGYRLRGQEQVVRAVEDIRRAARFGVRTFLVYDEGLLWVLGKMRADGFLPSDAKFKVSAHAGHGNPCSAKMLEELGADSLNPVRDIQLQMLAAIRAAIDIPIDIHTENPKSSGGFIRHYEVPDFIRVSAPVYLKTGGSVAANHSYDTTADEAKKRAKQVLLVKRVSDEYYPEAEVSP